MNDEQRAIDNGTWNGSAAMSTCANAEDPAAAYAAVCAGRREGDPALQSTWALPHHMGPGMGPNADGVRNSLSRLPQTQGLTNEAAARRHLDAHMAEMQAGRAEELPLVEFGYRFLSPEGAEDFLPIRAVLDGDRSDGRLGTLYGRLANFNQWAEVDSSIEGHFMEQTAPGSFSKTLAENRSRMQVIFDHGQDKSIGRKPLGPLENVTETDAFVDYQAALIDTSYNRDLIPGLRAGVYGSSYRFAVPRGKETWLYRPTRSDYNPASLPERTVREVRLKEFGPTPFPVYAGTTAGVRSTTDDYLSRQLAERGAGFAHSDVPPEPDNESTPEPPVEAPVIPPPALVAVRAVPVRRAVSREEWLDAMSRYIR